MDYQNFLNFRRKTIYYIGFLFALSNAIPAYIFSDFLAKFFNQSVGIVYSAAAIVSIFAFMWLSFTLERFGNYKTAMSSLFVSAISIALLPLFTNKALVAALFILIYVANMIVVFNFDIFLEKETLDEKTGAVRGDFLSFVNLAWIVAPFIAGNIIGENNHQNVFWLSSALFVPIMIMLAANFRDFKDSPYKKISIKQTLINMPYHQNTTKIMLSNFLLQFFFAWMIIYMPIYLREHIGLSWQEIGIIFSIMLTPFVLLEAPLGRLADKKYGEKEMLSIGFIIMAISTILVAFIYGKNIVIWAIVLFMTRVGASMVEIMNETYFFKKNSDRTPDLIGVFRLTRPFAYLIAPVIASMLLMALDYPSLFVVLGILMLYGLRYSLTIKDTL